MKTIEGALTDEQIVEAGYMHTVEDDEPLFAFDRKELIAMVRELLARAQPPVADGPEGCTVADAQMLRAANHALGAENDMLRMRLRPFAQIAVSKLSYAVVEYHVEGDPEKQVFRSLQMQRAFNRAVEALAENIPVDCHEVDHGTHVEMVPHFGEPGRPADAPFTRETPGTAPQPSQPAQSGEPVVQIIEDESNGAWAAFEKSPNADMSNRDDLWPIWQEAWETCTAARPALSAVVLDDERAAFEAQFERTIGYKPERYATFNYERDNAKSLWKWWQWAWQACAASPQATTSPRLIEAARQVESWWITEGKNRFDGAPAAMFNLRDALSSVPQATATQPAQTVQSEAVALQACRAIVKWCDTNPPAGDALWCVQLARQAIAAQPPQPIVAQAEAKVGDEWALTADVPDTLLVNLFYATQGDITKFRIKARALLTAAQQAALKALPVKADRDISTFQVAAPSNHLTEWERKCLTFAGQYLLRDGFSKEADAILNLCAQPATGGDHE